MTIFEIKNPKTDETTPSSFAQILANFANSSPIPWWKRLIFGKKDPALFLEIAVFGQTIHFYLTCDDYLSSYFYSQLTSQYPKAQILKTADYLIKIKEATYIATGKMNLAREFYLPLNTFRNFREIDPISSILGIFSKFEKQDSGLFQMALLPAGGMWQTSAQKIVDQGIPELTPTGQTRRKPLPNERTIREKISQNGLKADIRVIAASQTSQRTLMLLAELSGSLGVFSRGDGNALSLKRPGMFGRKKLFENIFKRQPNDFTKYQVLNIEEITSLFHPPTKAVSSIKNIAWGGQLLSEAPENLPIAGKNKEENKQINFFARTEFKNKIHTFGIKKEDRRRHTYVIGKTGTGKTTLIANMAINDMKNGEGVAVVDPHGDLSTILLDFIPKNRINDTAYLDPSDTKFPFHLNPLELDDVSNITQAELVASGIVSIFHKLYAHSWGPRLEYILRNSLLTLAQIPSSTLVDVPPLLADPDFRRKKIAKLNDRVLMNFWKNEYEKMGERLRSEAIAPILNKVGQFVASPMIRNIIGHPKSTVDFSKMMDQGKIVIANLSQGKLGEDNAALLGAMFITKMQLSAMSRVYQEEEKRKDFYLYVDEFQNFATSSFIKILSEARKYRLDLVLANQYIGQVDMEVKKAIFGNVGTIVSFLVGAEDARSLSFEFGENYEQKDFVSLGNYQILLKMGIDGLTSNPFYAATLPLPRSRNQNREKVIKVSRERYGRKSK